MRALTLPAPCFAAKCKGWWRSRRYCSPLTPSDFLLLLSRCAFRSPASITVSSASVAFLPPSSAGSTSNQQHRKSRLTAPACLTQLPTNALQSTPNPLTSLHQAVSNDSVFPTPEVERVLSCTEQGRRHSLFALGFTET